MNYLMPVFLILAETPDHSWETAIISLFITIASLLLFIFWTKKKAIMNFRAWALLVLLINLIFWFNYCPYAPLLVVDGLIYQLTTFGKVFLRFLQYLTSGITIWRLWQYSEKYLPKDIIYTLEQKRVHPFRRERNKILARTLALWNTLKYGGNHLEKDSIVKKNIKKRIITEIK